MSQVQEIEVGMEEAKAVIARKSAVLKLESNREFKKLILEGYFKEEASRLALLSADPRIRPEDQADAILQIQSISKLHQYLHGIIMQGTIAEQALAEYEEALEEARVEEEYGEVV